MTRQAPVSPPPVPAHRSSSSTAPGSASGAGSRSSGCSRRPADRSMPCRSPATAARRSESGPHVTLGRPRRRRRRRVRRARPRRCHAGRPFLRRAGHHQGVAAGRRPRVRRMIYLDAHAPLGPDDARAVVGRTPVDADGMIPFAEFVPDEDVLGDAVDWRRSTNGRAAVGADPRRAVPCRATGRPRQDVRLRQRRAVARSSAPYAEAARRDPTWRYVEVPATHWLMYTHPRRGGGDHPRPGQRLEEDDERPNDILCTHTGSLPRPDDLVQIMWAVGDGIPVDAAALEARVEAAVHETVRRQVAAGVSIVNDGEMSKPSYATYVKDRLSGFDGESVAELPLRRPRRLPAQCRARGRQPGPPQALGAGVHGADHACGDPDAARRDMEHLVAAAAGDRRGRHVLQRRVAGSRVVVLRQRVLRHTRGVRVRHRRGDAPRVRGDRRSRGDRPTRLPRPGDGSAHDLRRARRRRVPPHHRGQHRRHQPRRAQHPRRAVADAPVLGQLPRPAPSRRPDRRDHRPRVDGQAADRAVRGGQPAPRPRVAGRRASSASPTTR